jgi:hypothetical protein
MPWLIDQFNFNSILLTRHPCAIVASQLRLPSWRDIDPTAKYSDKFPYSSYYYSKLKTVGKIDTREKYLAFIWALGFENTAMRQDISQQWHTISYEGLFNNFNYEINRINQRYLYNLNSNSIDRKIPSKSTKENSLDNLKTSMQLSSWKKELSKNQIQTILNVLEKFEIDIYTEKLEPDYDKLYLTNH